MPHVDHEYGIRQAWHVLDPGETTLEFAALTRQADDLFLAELINTAVFELCLEILEALDRVLYGFIVREGAAEPTVVDIGAAATRGLLFYNLRRLTLGPDEQCRASIGGELAHKLHRLEEQR